jgi:hypothetical protein
MRVLQRPAPAGVPLGPDKLDRLGRPVAGRGAGRAQVVEVAEHVVVPERRRGQDRPLAVRLLEGEQPCAPAFGCHPGAFGRYLAGGRAGQVAHHLPADRRVAAEQPVDDVHADLPYGAGASVLLAI